MFVCVTIRSLLVKIYTTNLSAIAIKTTPTTKRITAAPEFDCVAISFSPPCVIGAVGIFVGISVGVFVDMFVGFFLDEDDAPFKRPLVLIELKICDFFLCGTSSWEEPIVVHSSSLSSLAKVFIAGFNEAQELDAVDEFRLAALII